MKENKNSRYIEKRRPGRPVVYFFGLFLCISFFPSSLIFFLFFIYNIVSPCSISPLFLHLFLLPLVHNLFPRAAASCSLSLCLFLKRFTAPPLMLFFFFRLLIERAATVDRHATPGQRHVTATSD